MGNHWAVVIMSVELHTITALAKETGVASSALRFWESVGLICSARRSPSGYRLFDRSTFRRVTFIRTAQAAGLALEDIRLILDAGSTSTCDSVQNLLRARQQEVRRRMIDLKRIDRALSQALRSCVAGDQQDLCRHVCR